MMKNTIKKAAAVAAGGMLAFGAMAPLASAQTVAAVPVPFVSGGFGNFTGFNGNLGQLFVLGTLFGGPFGNGVIGSGTSLGDLLILNQIFNRNNFGIWW